MARKTPGSGPFAAALAGVVLVLTLAARTLPVPDGTSLAVLPPIPFIAASLLLPLALWAGWRALARRRPALAAWPAAAWSVLLLPVLPWLPLPLPEAVLVWLGPLRWLAWVGALIAGLAALGATRDTRPWPARLVDRTHGAWAAGLAALLIFGGSYAAVRTILPGGDEPHYLVIAESLRRDGDLAIDDNHERGDYLAFFPGELAPDYLRRGVDRRIYSIHAPGLPALLLPAYAIGGYGGAVAALILVSAWGAGLLWRLVRDVGGDAGAAWFAWAACVLSAPILFHAFTIFPDGVAGVAALVALRVLADVSGAASAPGATRRLWVRLGAAGGALALLPWLHTRAAIIALVFGASLGGVCLWRRVPRGAIAALVVLPVLSAIAWFGTFLRLYGTIDPSAPYGGYTQTALANLSAGAAGLLVDAQFGLLVVAPVFALAGVGLVWMLAGRGAAPATVTGERIVALTIVVGLVAYVAAAGSYRMWWGGASAPARFLVPMLLPLGLPIGLAWRRAGSVATRALAVAALILTAAVTAVLLGVDGGRLAYGSRLTVAGWTRWASPVVDLARALPGVHRTTPGAATAVAAVWAGAAALAWIAIAALARGGADAVMRARAFSALVIGLAATAAVGVAWRVDDGSADPRLPGGAAQAALAAWQRQPRATLVEVGPGGAHRAAPSAARAHLVLPARAAGSGRQLRLELPVLVPGRYRLTRLARLPSPLALRAGRSGLDWRRLDPAVVDAIDLDVPVAVPAATAWPLDASAALTLPAARALTIEPVGLTPSATGGADAARQVVRYGSHDVFFLDEESYPEAPGFWVRPGRARIVVGETAGPVGLFVRNAPIANRIELAAGAWRRTLDLAPGEELRVEVPPAGRATPIEIRAARGVRPFDGDHRNRDFRLLGVWISLVD